MASTLLDGSSGWASVFDFSIFCVNMDSSEDHTGLSRISLWWTELDCNRRHANVGILKQSSDFLRKIKWKKTLLIQQMFTSLSLLEEEEEEVKGVSHSLWDYEVNVLGRAHFYFFVVTFQM